MQTAVYGVYKKGIVELEEKPAETREGNRVMVVFFENASKKNNMEDFFRLRGKYSGKMSVDKFLEQKYKDMELER
ncbi:MAG: hypothetical protein FWF67_04020 [Fibromonadales bacterium]|nr:hypothetical protein [Fibromonadales bacterium]